MRNVPENELFSAYLDGELTAAEQAEVEQLLAASPAARQLMDELRALSATLQSLPVYKLSEDLGPEVLRQAERRILTGRARPSGFSSETERPTPAWRMIARRMARPRTWIWPAAAVAVALLLGIFLPERGQRLAQRPAEKRMASAAVSNVPVSAETSPIGAAEAPAPESAPRPMKDSAPAAIFAEKIVERIPEEKAAASLRMKEDEKSAPAGQPRMAPAKPGPAASAPVASPMVVAKQDEAPPGPTSSSEGQRPADKADKLAETASRPMKAAKQPAAGVAPMAEKALGGPMPAEEMWLVICNVTPEAIGEGLLDQVLARRRIARSEPARQEVEQLNRAAAPFAYAPPRPMKAKAPSRAGGEREFSEKADRNAGKLVYVHAVLTSADLQAVVADLKARPQMVASVSGKTVVPDYEVFQAKRGASFGAAFSPAKRGAKEAAQSDSGAMDLKGTQRTLADSQIIQPQAVAPPGMPGAMMGGAGLDRAQAGQSRTAGRVVGGAMPGQPAQQAADGDRVQNAPRTAPPGMAAGQGSGRLSQSGRAATRSQTTLGFGTLGAQQSAAAEQAFQARQQFSRSVPHQTAAPQWPG